MQNVSGTSNQNTGLEDFANDLNFVNSNLFQTFCKFKFFQTFESLLFYNYLQILTSIVICHVLYFKNKSPKGIEGTEKNNLQQLSI